MNLFSNIWNSFSYIRRPVSNIRKWFSNIREYRFLSTLACHIIRFVSFRFVSFRFVSFRFDLFRFVSICFVSFRSVSFRSVSFLFRFALYRDPWKTEDPRVNFEKRFAHYEIYTWTLCNSYLHEKQTSRIQSLNTFIYLSLQISKSIYQQYKYTSFINGKYIPSNIVQSAIQKCLELHNFVTIFIKKILGEDLQYPLFTCICYWCVLILYR